MQYRLTMLIVCLIATLSLAGCRGGESSFSSLFGSDGLFGGGLFGSGGSSGDDGVVTSSLPGGSSSGGSTSGSGSSGSGSTGGLVHSPEPATFALLGSGLLIYALLRRKKRK